MTRKSTRRLGRTSISICDFWFACFGYDALFSFHLQTLSVCRIHNFQFSTIITGIHVSTVYTFILIIMALAHYQSLFSFKTPAFRKCVSNFVRNYHASMQA